MLCREHNGKWIKSISTVSCWFRFKTIQTGNPPKRTPKKESFHAQWGASFFVRSMSTGRSWHWRSETSSSSTKQPCNSRPVLRVLFDCLLLAPGEVDMRVLRCCFFRPRHPAYLGVTHFGVGLKGNQRFETHSATWYLFGSYGNQLPLRDLEIQVITFSGP